MKEAKVLMVGKRLDELSPGDRLGVADAHVLEAGDSVVVRVAGFSSILSLRLSNDGYGIEITAPHGLIEVRPLASNIVEVHRRRL